MKKLAAAALCGFLAASAGAKDWGVSASVGTTGLGLHASTAVASNLNARVGLNFFDFSKDVNTTSVNYDAKLKLQTVDALLDYFPMAGGFRVSGGVVYNNSKLDATGRRNAAGTVTLNGTAYNVAGLNAEVDFRKLAPYLGIGWGNPVARDKGWGFMADVGVLFQGSPRSNVTAVGCTGANCGTLQADLAAENARLQDELKDFKAFPVVRIGASYKF